LAFELYSSIAGWAGVIACAIITICIYVFDKSFVSNNTTEKRIYLVVTAVSNQLVKTKISKGETAGRGSKKTT
jgi:hypothetical protein